MGYLTKLSAGTVGQPARATPKPPAPVVSTAPEKVPQGPSQTNTVSTVEVSTEQEPTPAPRAEAAPSAHTPPPPEPKLTVTQPQDDTAARQAHEAAEAKRKAEFDTKQAEKRAQRQATLDRLKAMNGAELLEAAAGRVAADTERLTRRNMKEAVAEHISAKCREDAAFAMLVMDPDKSMINCFQYINRMAQEYAEQEMEDNGIERQGVYGLDVPDGLCYQWAEDYFKDENAKEDHKDDEKFIPQPYVPTGRKTSAGKTAKKKSETGKASAEKPTDTGMEQISLM